MKNNRNNLTDMERMLKNTDEALALLVFVILVPSIASMIIMWLL